MAGGHETVGSSPATPTIIQNYYQINTMKIIQNEKITIMELKEMSKNMFGNFVKAVIDIEQEIMVVDAALHADQEDYLLENGSQQENLWGINIYPELSGEDMIEFDSMINLRPYQDNKSRGVENSKIKEKIIIIVNNLIIKN